MRSTHAPPLQLKNQESKTTTRRLALFPKINKKWIPKTTYVGLAKLREFLARSNKISDIKGLDQVIPGEIVRNATLLIATPNPQEFKIWGLAQRLVGFDKHHRFSFTEAHRVWRDFKGELCDAREDVEEALLLDLGLELGSPLLQSTKEDLYQ